MRRVCGGVLAGVVLATACHSQSSSSASAEGTDAGADVEVEAEAGPPPPAEVDFPSSFMWGSSTAGFQVESGDSHTDWTHWVATAGKISNGDNPDVGGPDALDHIDDDIASMKAIGLTSYRLSIEWARVFPTEAAFTSNTPDPAGLAAYDGLLQKLQAAGIRPMVTLAHFTMPDWLSDGVPSTESKPQGWERTETPGYFTQWCTFAAQRWGGKVDWWVTINEPLPYVLGGFVQGSFPPGDVLDVSRALNIVKIEARAHAACFDAIHAADTVDADGDGKAALVSVAAHQRTFHPYDPTNPDDVTAAARVDYIWNQWFLNAIVLGNWDDNLDQSYTEAGDAKGDPTLVGRADYIGVNYYSDTLVSAHTGLVLPVINAAVYEANMPTPRPKTDFGWDIYPEGLGTVLDQAAKLWGKPLVVTENGIADAADANRARFLLEHLYQLGWAMQRGDQVLGYFHWALVDNFEWANGFCPHFGLTSYDKTSGARTVKKSAGTYQSIITRGKVTTDDVAAAAPYAAPNECQ